MLDDNNWQGYGHYWADSITSWKTANSRDQRVFKYNYLDRRSQNALPWSRFIPPPCPEASLGA
jgi:hypothetical protein